MTRPLAAVIMAAGLGTRMRSSTPKHLHPLLGRRMVDWVIEAARSLQPERVVAVVAPDRADAYDGVEVAVQEHPRGTGDAVAAARGALDGFDGDVLVLPGDAPLLPSDLLERLVEEHRRERPAATVLTVESTKPLAYGRVVRGTNGDVQYIVEERDATIEERAVTELNASIYVFSAGDLWWALERLDAENALGEYYLTDTIRHLFVDGRRVAALSSPDLGAVQGVNTRVELAEAAAVLRERVLRSHMLAGVTIVDPLTTWVDADVRIEPDAVIHPFTVLRGRTEVGAESEIGPHVVAVDARVGAGAVVGPFCYLRPGTVLEAEAKAGTFVELKNARIGARAKVPHLSYVGDADIGERTNIGAGAITANFPHEPGRPKGRTRIGRNVRTGVHNAFRAPVEIGDDAWIAAGAVITDDVPPGSLAGFPPKQETKEGWVYDRHGKRDD
jgi:bifunctional UDP-N-acetylglucosamine pyrophosphorylase / glucosamine-1-phosphate N-acetyltransferase